MTEVGVQLALFDAPVNGDTPRGTKASLGLAKELPGLGAERLVIELLKRGDTRRHASDRRYVR